MFSSENEGSGIHVDSIWVYGCWGVLWDVFVGCVMGCVFVGCVMGCVCNQKQQLDP